MSNVYNAAARVSFEPCRLLLDTNVWFAIEGLGLRPMQQLQVTYSNFLAQARHHGCTLVINAYVVGELFNRALKNEYSIAKDDWTGPGECPGFKEFRTREDFKDALATVTDTCLLILGDCEYLPVDGTEFDLATLVQEVGTGAIDFTDAVLREHCRKNDLTLVTHDRDFSSSGINVVTANRRLLDLAK